MNVGVARDARPSRIVCLTEETTETLYLLGEQDRIVGISGYTVRPPEARRDKPRVSAFTSAKLDRILELEPDLVLAFSDMQADIVAALARAGLSVHVFNQRSIDGILRMVRTVGDLVGVPGKAEALIAALRANLEATAARAATLPRRPRVYFEEWDEPPICGIGWVSELIGIAGGEDVFADQACSAAARGRIIEDPMEVVRRAPDVIVGSWCGKKFRPEQVRTRAGWQDVPAVRDGALHEVKSPEILQPGPAALTDGLARLERIVRDWAEGRTQG
ncbi:MAG: cobalamin-binding protein [Burkholderiales bacterium]|nr:MAG: cobalamin-binding protein [Burkholderiales bacterium]